MTRRSHSSELVQAKWGCERCTAGGIASNAQATAAQHHDKRGHRTWVETTMRITYGAVSGSKASDQRSML